MAWFVVLTLIVLTFGAGALRGAPYLPILDRDREPLLDLAKVGKGSVVIDLGSGDGRLLRACGRRGATSIGYEINPLLYLVSRIVTWRDRSTTTIHLGDFWTAALPPADVIYVFLIDRYMAKLNTKLLKEVKHPTTVVSFVFEIPGRSPIASNQNSFVYRYGELEKANQPG